LDEADKAPIEVVVILKALVEETYGDMLKLLKHVLGGYR
jgi:hypothetical protein